MIVQTKLNNNLIYTYSDKNMKIKQVQTNILYYEAIDTLPCGYTYEETDIPRDDLEEEESDNG